MNMSSYSCCHSSVDTGNLAELSATLKLVAEPNRLRILCILGDEGTHCVCEFTEHMPTVSQSLLSHHLADLRGAGLDVTLVDPADGNPDVSDVVGLVAGAEADTTNLALAAHTRDYNPTVHLVVRQHHHSNAPLVDAFEPDSVFSPNDLVVRESLAWVVTPLFRSFLDHVRAQDDDWASAVLGRLLANCGEAAPHGALVRIDAEVAPAVVRWMDRGRTLTVGDLTRESDRWLRVLRYRNSDRR